MDANFLPLAPRKVDQLGGNRQAAGLFQQRPQPAAQRAARHVGASEGVLDHRVVGAADFERSLAGADVQACLAVQIAFQNQLADELQFCLGCVRAHASSLFVVGHDGLEEVTEPLVASGVVLACHLEQQLLDRVQARSEWRAMV